MPADAPPSPALTLRRAEPRDLPRIASLAAALVRMHHETDPSRFFLIDDVENGYAWWLGRELQRPDAAVIVVACRGERIVGYAYGALEERDWNLLLDAHGAIHDVFVEIDERGAGAGRLLVEALAGALTQKGAPRIVLSTMVGNGPAQALFRRCGFRATMIEMMRG